MASPDSVLLPSMITTFGVMVTYELAPESIGGQGHLPPAKLLIGLGTTFIGLGLLGTMAPGVSKALAVTIASTAFLFRGVPLAEKYFTGKTEVKENPLASG